MSIDDRKAYRGSGRTMGSLRLTRTIDDNLVEMAENTNQEIESTNSRRVTSVSLSRIPSRMSERTFDRRRKFSRQISNVSCTKSHKSEGSYPTYSCHRVQRQPSVSRHKPKNTNEYVAVDMTKSYNSVIDVAMNPWVDFIPRNNTERRVRSPSFAEPVENRRNELYWNRLRMSRAKLKAAATTSELLSGFAMVALVELQICENQGVPEWLIILFVTCTTVLVSVHIIALMISTYLLPNVDAISKSQLRHLTVEPPHEKMRGFIELAWIFSVTLGLFLFLVEIVLISWVQFYTVSQNAAIVCTSIVIPVLICFVTFAVYFYRSLIVSKCEETVDSMKELEYIKQNLDQVSIGTGM